MSTVLHHIIVLIRVKASINKDLLIVTILVTLSPFTYHLRSVTKTRKPKDEQLCITVHTINNIYDTGPLDNSSIKELQIEHYLT